MPYLGVGAYPTDAYYDQNRPSWLPYFIDDSAESAAKYGTDSIVGQMGGVVGWGAAAVAGGIADATAGAVLNAVSTSLKGTALLIGAAVLGFYLLKR